MGLIPKRYGLSALVICGIAFASLPVGAQEVRPNGPDQGLVRDPELRALIDGNLRMSTERLMIAEGLAAGIPAPAPRALSLPAYPAGVSRTQTGADLPPAAALAR